MEEYQAAGERLRREGVGQEGAKMSSNKITLASAIETATLHADKMLEMLMDLMQRMEPIRSEDEKTSPSNEDGIAIARITEYGSPYARRVDLLTSKMLLAQRRLGSIINDLDLP